VEGEGERESERERERREKVREREITKNEGKTELLHSFDAEGKGRPIHSRYTHTDLTVTLSCISLLSFSLMCTCLLENSEPTTRGAERDADTDTGTRAEEEEEVGRSEREEEEEEAGRRESEDSGPIG